MPNKGLNIFVSYAHNDVAFKDTLRTHLAGLLRRKVIEVWDDHYIDGGEDWRQAISKAMESCDIALLLVSPDFLASEFIHSEELSRLLARREREGIRVVPIILRPCRWQSEQIGNLQALPKHGRPIASFTQDHGDRDQAWADIVAKLEDWARDYRERTRPAGSGDAVTQSSAAATAEPGVGRPTPGTVVRDRLRDGSQGPERAFRLQRDATLHEEFAPADPAHTKEGAQQQQKPSFLLPIWTILLVVILAICSTVIPVILLRNITGVSRQEFEEVRVTANNLLSQAREAKPVAQEGNSAAEQAQRAADNAQACCNDNVDKLDRMFERAMRR